MIIEIKEVPGLYLVENAISREDQKQIINSLKINNGNECKQIHTAREFGWSFLKGLYHPGTYTSKDYLQIPIWVKNIWKKLIEELNLKSIIGDIEIIDNILINTYEKDDALVSHVDDINFWDNWVVGLSLESDIVMDFMKITTRETHPIKIPALSVYILTGNARYSYEHSIKRQKYNNFRRISITFRTISAQYLPNSIRELVSREQL